jgi:DNA-binding IclR family transcriptional regulator
MTTQSLDRAIDVLRLLAAAGTEGRRLVDLQRDTRLAKPTVHRILDTLRHHGFVEQVEATRCYRLGPELGVLGWSASRQLQDLRELAEPDMHAVAERTGDTSFLIVRSGLDTVCLDRQSGSYPVKAFTVDVGTRRPLGVGAGGIAILAALGAEEADEMLQALRPRLGAAWDKVRQSVANARREGHALSDGFVLQGVRGLAVSLSDVRGKPVAALSCAAISERVQGARVAELVRILHLHARRIEQKLAAAAMPGTPVARVIRASRTRS